MDKIIKDFLITTKNSLDQLNHHLSQLSRNPQNQQILANIFIITGSIKNNCQSSNFVRLKSISHVIWHLIDQIKNHDLIVTKEIIGAINEAMHTIGKIISYIEQQGEEEKASDEDLLEKINIIILNLMSNQKINHNASNEIKQEEVLTEDDLEETQDQDKSFVAKSQDDIVESLKKEVIKQGLKLSQNDENAHDSKGNTSHQTIRVNLDVLEGLMLMVSELVLNRNQLQQIARSQKGTVFSAPIQRLGHITSEIQEMVMKTRMQPISNAWATLPKLVRGLANELNKKIELKMIGEDTELDRQLIEFIKDPLIHMVRNACDHGIELPLERIAAGKEEFGVLTLKAYHQGGHIIIEILDNGRGLDIKKIKSKIISEGLVSETELSQMSELQIYQFIFKAGFSTVDKVNPLSVKGLGMDVVKTNIEKIKGTIELKSELGKGTGFFIKIPLTLAIMSVLIVECRGEKFAIPQINVLELVKTAKNSEFIIEYINARPVLRLRKSILSLEYLSKILAMKNDHVKNDEEIFDVVICEVGGCIFGIIVDKVYDMEEIVVKPVVPILKSIDIYSGITLLGDGSVIMILDPNGIFKFINNKNEIKDSREEKEEKDLSHETQVTKFLLVKAGNKSLKAIPVELVSRLEEIDINNIEYSGNNKTIQYRDKLMYLTDLDEELAPTNKYRQVISFTDDDRILGIMVDEITDIVEHKLEIVSSIETPGYLGSMIINGKTTNLVDVAYYFHAVFGDQSSSENQEIENAQGFSRILLVDDSLFFRKIMPQKLLPHGFEVIAVENANLALELLEEDRNFIMMIVDYNMPEISGGEFATMCEKNIKLKDIPIIIASSHADMKKIDNKNKNIKAHVSKSNHEKLLQIIVDFSKEINNNHFQSGEK